MKIQTLGKTYTLDHLISGAVYMVRGQLMQAAHQHTWVLYLLDDDGNYVEETPGAWISCLHRGNGVWVDYFRGNGEHNTHGPELTIPTDEIFYLAPSPEALDIDGRFRAIMRGMDWT